MRIGINVLLSVMVIVSFLLAIPLHEWAHAQMASWLGDRTPKAEGRQTLVWSAHLDPIGTLLCVILAFQSGIGFGWGRPVKPDPWKMKVGANTGVLIVACAGPIFSLIVGLVTALIAHFFWPIVFSAGNPFLDRILQFLIVFASVNIGIALVNLIPLYPLDGYQILYTLLPSKQAVQFSRSATYGPFIILAIFFLLPFVGQITNLEAFPLFRLATYIWLGAMSIIALVFGAPFGYSLGIVLQYYGY